MQKPIFQKAAELSLKSTQQERDRFYIRLFKMGKDWFDVSGLTQAVGIKDTDDYIANLYEDWQVA